MTTLTKNVIRFVLLLLALVMSAMPAAAQDAAGAVAVQVTGRFARGGEFEGTATINKFERRGDEIVAIGLVQGTLRRGNRTMGSVIGGQVTWPVALRAGSLIVAKGGASASVRPVRVGWTLVQAEVCPVLQVALGPIDVNLLGLTVSLSPVALDLNGVVGTPLGDLVCEVSELLGNVAGLVGLLNSILGLLTGLLGGLLGGLGGAIPTIP